MEINQHHSTVDLVEFFELESEEKQELLFEFTHSTWEETEECHGFPAKRREYEISGETYYLNGVETTLEELEGKYGEKEIDIAIIFLIDEEIG